MTFITHLPQQKTQKWAFTPQSPQYRKPARGKIECKYRAIDITAQGWDDG
jgi:hypothetical protein